MNPTNPTNPLFSSDFQKFVLQDFGITKPQGPPPKPFSIDPTEKSLKSKKDLKKPKDKKEKDDEEDEGEETPKLKKPFT